MRTEARISTGDIEGTGRRFSWRTLGVVVAAAASTSVLLIPFSTALLGQGDGAEIY
jgi:hypothetical protein